MYFCVDDGVYYELRNQFLLCVIECTMKSQLSVYRIIRSCVQANVFRNFEAQKTWPWLSDGHVPNSWNLRVFFLGFLIVMPFSQRSNSVFTEYDAFLSMFRCLMTPLYKKCYVFFPLFSFYRKCNICICCHFLKCGATGYWLYFYPQLKQTGKCLLYGKKECEENLFSNRLLHCSPQR